MVIFIFQSVLADGFFHGIAPCQERIYLIVRQLASDEEVQVLTSLGEESGLLGLFPKGLDDFLGHLGVPHGCRIA